MLNQCLVFPPESMNVSVHEKYIPSNHSRYDIIPFEYVYRADDPNFGVAQNVVYDHAYGLTASSLDLYVQSLEEI